MRERAGVNSQTTGTNIIDEKLVGGRNIRHLQERDTDSKDYKRVRDREGDIEK